MWQVSISTTADAEAPAASFLEDLCQLPVSVYCDEKTGGRMVSVYPPRAPSRSTVASLRVAAKKWRARVSVKPLPRQNWAESWKKHFKPLDIDGALLIKPGWSKRRPRAGQQVIILDPGLSFGTGQHPTTLFCLQQLTRCRRIGQKQSFLDIGTGSGILAIAAAKLGYEGIEAFDFDPVAVRVAKENARRNRVGRPVRIGKKDLTRMPQRSPKKFDVVCANLVCDLLIQEASKICNCLKPGGRLIVAGILRREFPALRKVLQNFGLTCRATMADINWKSGQFVMLCMDPTTQGTRRRTGHAKRKREN